METFFKRLWYRFMVDSTKIENALFPCKTALSKASAKTHRMGSPKKTKFCQLLIYFLENFVSV